MEIVGFDGLSLNKSYIARRIFRHNSRVRRKVVISFIPCLFIKKKKAQLSLEMYLRLRSHFVALV